MNTVNIEVKELRNEASNPSELPLSHIQDMIKEYKVDDTFVETNSYPI